MTKIELKNITRIYEDGTEALRGVDLAVGEGEFLMLLGPTGSGKSTLLRLIAGLDDPTEGDILFDGVSVLGQSPRKRNTAMVFQNYSLYPDRSIYRNIAFPLESLRLPEDEIDRRVRKAAEELGLSGLLGRRPRELSGGEKQRTAIARAWVRNPSVMLLDEPMANLDPAMRGAVLADLQKIREKTGTTLIYVTHDQTEAMENGTRIALMNEGRIEQTGMPQEVYKNPGTVFAAGFLGRPKMNFFSGTARKEGENLLIETDAVTLAVQVPDLETVPEDGTAVTAGIRPEDLVPGEGDVNHFTAKVQNVTSPDGSICAECSVGNDTVTAVMKNRIPRVGETIVLGAEPDAICVFDGASGKTIRKKRLVRELAVRPRTDEGRAEEEEKSGRRGLALFGSVLLNDWWELMKLNVMFLISCIGIITIPAALTAMSRVTVLMKEEEVFRLRKDYAAAFRKDFLKSLAGGGFLGALVLLFGYAAFLYAQLASSRGYLIFLGAIMIFLVMIVWMTGMYFFPMNAMVDLPVKALLRNSFILALTNVKSTLAAFFSQVLLLGILGIGLWPKNAVYIIAIMFSLTSLINSFCVYPVIRRRVIKQ